MGLQRGNEAFPTLYLHGVKAHSRVATAASLKCCSQTDTNQMSTTAPLFTSLRSQSASSALAAAVTGKPNNLER